MQCITKQPVICELNRANCRFPIKVNKKTEKAKTQVYNNNINSKKI